MTIRALEIPYALCDRDLVLSPHQAERGKSYFCPACHDRVFLRKGSIKVAHFAHNSSNTCNQETIIHKTAKRLVQQVITDWKSGRSPAPSITRHCKDCGLSHVQPVPDKVDSAAIEYRLPDGLIADVALLARDHPEAAIEIRVTHAVDEAKASSLLVPFIELDGMELIAHPNEWLPLVDKFKPFQCPHCDANLLSFQRKNADIAARLSVELPSSYYRYAPYRCWKCKQEILVYAWPSEDAAPARLPIPRTIQYRFSKTIGDKYWANVCPFCNSIQGANFLHSEPDGPFFCLSNDIVASEEQFQLDLKTIANYVSSNGLI